MRERKPEDRSQKTEDRSVRSSFCLLTPVFWLLFSKEAQVVPHTHCAHANVKIRKADTAERQPGPEHVVFVEERAQAPISVAAAGLVSLLAVLAEWAAEAIEPAADQVAHRMATHRVTGEEDNVNQHDQ